MYIYYILYIIYYILYIIYYILYIIYICIYIHVYAGGWFTVRAFLCFFWPMGWGGLGWGGVG